MTKSPPKEPTTSHACSDGVIRPGKGAHGKGADQCSICWSEYLRERRKRIRIEKLKTPLSQLGLKRGHLSIKHGFYRKKLTADECALAEELHAEFHAQYDLDRVADDMMLQTGITNYVKSLREEPKNPGDHNVRDYQSYYEREFRDIMNKLSLTPKERKTVPESKDEVTKAIHEMFKTKTEELTGK